MNHSIHLRVTGCTRYKFRYVQIVNSGCKSSVSSCSGGRSMYCPRRKFSISPYAHTAQELSTRKSHGYRWVSSFNTFQLAHRRRWKRELSWHCMFKMIYMLAQLKLELSSLWIQPARHVLFQFPPACISSWFQLVSAGCGPWGVVLLILSCIFAGRICSMYRVKMGNFGSCLAIVIKRLDNGCSTAYWYHIILFYHETCTGFMNCVETSWSYMKKAPNQFVSWPGGVNVGWVPAVKPTRVRAGNPCIFKCHKKYVDFSHHLQLVPIHSSS